MKITINPQPKADEEDIFKAGTLVCSDMEDGLGYWIVLVSHDNLPSSLADGYFAGTIIHSSARPQRVGEHCTAWKRSEFVKFIGNILLEQE